MWYLDLKYSFECELRPLNNDTYVLKFGENTNGYDYSNIYVEHIVYEPIVITENEVREFVEPLKEPINIDSDDKAHVEESEEVHVEVWEDV